MDEVTRILSAMRDGDGDAAPQLLALVYAELRQMARAKMAREQPGQTLQPTALVHEAWVRLVAPDGRARFENRGHFFGAAAEAMRRILVDRARRKLALRHGGGSEHVPLDDVEIAMPTEKADELLAVHDALEALAAHDPRKGELVKLRYFAGLSIEEAAGVLAVSVPSANRDWAYARAWLFREITRGRDATPSG